jgi:hypothetical protein
LKPKPNAPKRSFDMALYLSGIYVEVDWANSDLICPLYVLNVLICPLYVLAWR